MFWNRISKSLKLLEYRNLSTINFKEKIKRETKAKAWQVHSYGDVSELQQSTIRIPLLQDPNELLINVEAASVNPIDLLIMGGYGRTLFQIPRGFQMELPLTLGRDFCGTVVHKGLGVGKDFTIGDRVYGFIPVHQQGSFSELAVANKSHVLKQPANLSAVESASLVYATMTAWSALYIFGNLIMSDISGTRVLILGASGGVGTVAVQLLKSQGCQVFATCSTDAVPLVKSLGADEVFDYKETDYLEKVAMEGRYHIILDCAKFGYENVPNTLKYSTYLVLNSPLLLNTDKYGLLGGLVTSASTFLQSNCKLLGEGKNVRWGFFLPSCDGFQFIHKLISEGKIRPVIHKEFSFEHVPDAVQEVLKGHLRGKVVIDFKEAQKL